MIFISHKKEDKGKALGLEKYLKERDIDSYVDVLDSEINPTNVTERIVDNLRRTTHLIVIFSEHTTKSMWVPFELGVAYERDSGIGVLKWADSEQSKIILPEYLNEFPVMNQSDIDKYIDLYKKPRRIVATESYDFSEAASSKGYAKGFIDQLKSNI